MATKVKRMILGFILFLCEFIGIIGFVVSVLALGSQSIKPNERIFAAISIVSCIVLTFIAEKGDNYISKQSHNGKDSLANDNVIAFEQKVAETA